MFRLRNPLLWMRERPVLALMFWSLVLVVSLRIFSEEGSRWDSILWGVAWVLLMAFLVTALTFGPGHRKGERRTPPTG